MDLGFGSAHRPDRGGFLSDLAAWLAETFGFAPDDPAPFRRALTHASLEAASYERLEFLGDRVLGLVMAEWLYELYPDEPEGVLSRRVHTLVSGATCAEVAREIGVAAHLRLGKGAQADGAKGSDNVLGDVVEALLGALYRERGLGAARDWVRTRWATRIGVEATAHKHPKAELQDWSLGNNRGLPIYRVVDESGPPHERRHTVAVRLGELEEVATASTKREAESMAARTLMAAVLAAEADRPRKRRRVDRAMVPARRG